MKPTLLTAGVAFCAALALPLTASAEAAPEAADAVAPNPDAPVTLSSEGLPPIWLQGEPVRGFDKGKLYIFEFWATWCGPCLQAMPHMEALHQTIKDRKDITIVGVNVMDETPSDRLMGFLKSKKITPSYAMAADDGRDGPVAKNWLAPLKINGIPHALAVRDGVVLWRGHPIGLNAAMLEAMAKPDFKPGTTIVDTAAVIRAERLERTQQLRITAAKDPAAALKLINDLAASGRIDDNELLAAYQTVFSTHIQYDRLAEARAMVSEMINRFPKDRNFLLNAGSWLLDTEQFEGKDTALAIDFADRALAMHPEDVAAMELKAAALFQAGDPKAAAVLQRKALDSTKLHAEIRALRDELAK